MQSVRAAFVWPFQHLIGCNVDSRLTITTGQWCFFPACLAPAQKSIRSGLTSSLSIRFVFLFSVFFFSSQWIYSKSLVQNPRIQIFVREKHFHSSRVSSSVSRASCFAIFSEWQYNRAFAQFEHWWWQNLPSLRCFFSSSSFFSNKSNHISCFYTQLTAAPPRTNVRYRLLNAPFMKCYIHQHKIIWHLNANELSRPSKIYMGFAVFLVFQNV